MPWLALAVALSAFAACFALGLWLGSHGRRAATVSAAGLLAVILTAAFLHYFPSLEFRLADFDLYVAVRPVWKYPFALAILGIGTMQATARWRRIIVETVAGCVFLVAAANLHAALGVAPPNLRGAPDADGICRQTSLYSCGAAAAATLLAQLGVPATEKEMAARCRTSPLTGTDEFYACAGLREKLAGTPWRARLVATDWQGLRGGPLPAMAVVNLTALVDHWIVILEAHDDHIVAADPLRGRVEVPRDRFLDDWRGALVTVGP